MSSIDNYRHEQKYLISTSQMHIIINRIKHIMQKDCNTGPDGQYNIRSLYFDDYYNRCYYENENGTDPREKFRIRIYNVSDERISLECKRKERGKTKKISCLLTKEHTETLMRGDYLRDFYFTCPASAKLTQEMMLKQMKPVVIVEYDRIPYVYKEGNVRVTFDTNISSSSECSRFFEKNISKRPVMPAGMQLMEVKYDEFLPDVIYRALQIENLQQITYSKYYICRKYGNKGR